MRDACSRFSLRAMPSHFLGLLIFLRFARCLFHFSRDAVALLGFALNYRASRDAVALLGLALNFRASRDAVTLLGLALNLKTVAAITTRTVSPKSDAHALSLPCLVRSAKK